MEEATQIKNSISIKRFLNLSGSKRNFDLLRVHLVRIKATKKEQEMVKNYFKLIVETDYFSESSYLYLVDNKSYKWIAKELNKKSGAYLGNITSKECKELFKKLGDDPYDFIFNKSKEYRNSKGENYLEGLNLMLEDLIGSSNERKRTGEHSEELVVNLTKDFDIFPTKLVEDYDESKMGEHIKKLRILSKNYLEFMLGTMDREYLKHINYVIETPVIDLNGDDRELKQIIRRLWMLDED